MNEALKSRTVGIIGAHDQLVEIRVFGIPYMSLWEDLADLHQSVAGIGVLLLPYLDGFALGIKHLDFGLASRCHVAETEGKTEVAVAILIGEQGIELEVFHDVLSWTSLKKHTTLDAAIAPEVLTLEIGGIGIAEYLDCQCVFLARLQEIADGKGGRQSAVFAIACQLTVDPAVESRLHAFEG